ncbi:hypothetical protein XANCAGTX0491_003712 [Xanthoria calcicola]
MVKLPSLKDICMKELRLDEAATKQLRADAKTFRAAWLADFGKSKGIIGNKELATRYFTDGYEVVGIKPGSLLWQPSGPDTCADAPRNILPRNEEILLRGVEKVFEKLEYNARDRRRRTHGHAASAGGQITADDDDDDGDEFPYILDLRHVWKTTASANGGGEQADLVAQHSTPITDSQAQDTSSAQDNHGLNTIDDPTYADIPIPREDSQDKEYEPSARLSDEPRRLPTTRKEIERRQHLPLSQRSSQSTLIPMEEAVLGVNKRKRNQGPTTKKSPGTAGMSAIRGGNFEEILEDASYMPVYTPPEDRRQKRDMTRPLLAIPNCTPCGAEDDAILHQSAAKRPRLGVWPEVLQSKTEGRAIGTESRPTSSGGPTKDDPETGAMAPFLQLGMEVPDSPSFGGEDDLDGIRTGQGDDRSRTYIAPTSPHHHGIGEGDDAGLYDVSTREASILGEDSPVREESVDLGPGFSGHEAYPRRNFTGDAMQLPPNIWILAPSRSWVFWDKSSLKDVTLSVMCEEVKSQMGLKYLANLRMKISN